MKRTNNMHLIFIFVKILTTMKKIFLFLLPTLFVSIQSFSQAIDLKAKALDAFKSEDYNKAIEYLEQAVKIDPKDAEIYYYLGWFNHYRSSDSRPMKGLDYAYAEKIFYYLDKAIELKPDYGDAKYFYAAEACTQAMHAMQHFDLEKMKFFYKKAYDKGGFPDWLLEFGRNMLMSCEEDGILFAAGDADFNSCVYLQLFEGIRPGVTVMPIGIIDRSWYVKVLKDGLRGGVTPLNISWSYDQIYDMHPSKWRTTPVNISYHPDYKKELNLNTDYKMQWMVEPDLFSDRNHSKIEGEAVFKRTYLSPQKSVLLQIVEDNYSSRKIYFSNAANRFFWGGLDKYMRNCGLVSELLPIDAEGTEYENNYQAMENLLQDKNFVKYASIKETDIPRISGVMFLYHYSLTLLAHHYKETSETVQLDRLKELYSRSFNIGFKPQQEKSYLDQLDK